MKLAQFGTTCQVLFFSSLKKHSTLLDSAVIMMSTVHLGPVLRYKLTQGRQASAQCDQVF